MVSEMPAFFEAYPDAAITIFWLIGGALGALCGFYVGRSLWRIVGAQALWRRIATIIWYALWGFVLGAIFWSSMISLLEIGYGEDAVNNLLNSGHNWPILVFFAALASGALFLWRHLQVVQARSSSGFFSALWQGVRLPIGLFVVVLIIFVICRAPVLNARDRAQATIATIEAQRITLGEVMGKNLPPPPDPTKVDATVAGIDSNANGIRDDIELAIFKLHPDSARIRAAELQYALTEQMFLTKVFDSATWKAVAEQDDRAYQCLASLSDQYVAEIENLELNTPARKAKFNEISKFTTSFGLPNFNLCDIPQQTFQN